MKKNKKSALEEKEGIHLNAISNEASIARIKNFRKKQPSVASLIQDINSGDKIALSRAITLVESKNRTHLAQANQIIEACISNKKNTLRVGITGVPGVGKSTFIEALGKYLTGIGKKVAVLAVDPTSSLSSGSILGDKTRMEALVKDENAFIRPSPSGDSLGGVARKTRESIILCEAANFDVILIETVGVGQSETAVHGMVDFFLLLKLAGAGDELQGIKRGIMEMTDTIVINKADGKNKQATKLASIEFTRALHFYPPKENGWIPMVLQCSALENEGISEVWQTIINFKKATLNSMYEKRKYQNKFWLLQTIEDNLKIRFYEDDAIQEQLKQLTVQVMNAKVSPFVAAEQLLAIHQKELK
ncbi:methylmalonyl-CoA mutase metallochaperone MeaB [Cellulophaga algicola DSM 14237]|uniref:Methylmalonyl-CoA mutase metallochaperone MeaB n=1 Tax=Cellulophaga algicola (strain DSM 14237 / IC166 / ACAM 630) TaxID=688270 RepID=E6XB66_CELAD|nr:methylmalonyl Co-A mutase-associated GTPase MeaB [Cellulophaga sp. E16_2]ADV49930.1 methylmalonyl-CoA mutase metallochaperone MeaB [Cellulophaga algicola DSM 14237]